MTGYNIQSQKIQAEKDKKQEKKKKGKWYRFPKPYKNCCQYYWGKKLLLFLCSRLRNLVLYGSVF